MRIKKHEHDLHIFLCYVTLHFDSYFYTLSIINVIFIEWHCLVRREGSIEEESL